MGPDENKHLNYPPWHPSSGISVRTAAEEMKKAGMLNSTTDPTKLAKRAFMHLDGVTDEWIEKIQVERVADGGSSAVLRGFEQTETRSQGRKIELLRAISAKLAQLFPFPSARDDASHSG